jgi:hypothetical protein
MKPRVFGPVAQESHRFQSATIQTTIHANLDSNRLVGTALLERRASVSQPEHKNSTGRDSDASTGADLSETKFWRGHKNQDTGATARWRTDQHSRRSRPGLTESKSKPRRKIDARLWRLGTLALAPTGAERITETGSRTGIGFDGRTQPKVKALATASRMNGKINSWMTKPYRGAK